MISSSWEKEVIEHFDRSAPCYGDSYGGNSPTSYFFQARRKLVMSRLNKLPCGKLLDVACGPGMMAESCVDQGFHYFGIDISKAMIAECRRKCADLDAANFYVGKMQNLPFPDSSFDVLLCMGGLEYVPAAEEAAARLELIRVVKPGGVLMISHLNRTSPYWMWYRFVYENVRSLLRLIRFHIKALLAGRAAPVAGNQGVPQGVPLRQFTARSSRRFMEARHHTIVEILYYAFNLFLPPFDERFPRLTVRTCEKLESLGNSLFSWLAMAFVLVVRKGGHRLS
jgi:ubiquinone/menaquinone biosynthesis C-methylase UbiE